MLIHTDEWHIYETFGNWYTLQMEWLECKCIKNALIIINSTDVSHDFYLEYLKTITK